MAQELQATLVDLAAAQAAKQAAQEERDAVTLRAEEERSRLTQQVRVRVRVHVLTLTLTLTLPSPSP